MVAETLCILDFNYMNYKNNDGHSFLRKCWISYIFFKFLALMLLSQLWSSIHHLFTLSPQQNVYVRHHCISVNSGKNSNIFNLFMSLDWRNQSSSNWIWTEISESHEDRKQEIAQQEMTRRYNPDTELESYERSVSSLKWLILFHVACFVIPAANSCFSPPESCFWSELYCSSPRSSLCLPCCTNAPRKTVP